MSLKVSFRVFGSTKPLIPNSARKCGVAYIARRNYWMELPAYSGCMDVSNEPFAAKRWGDAVGSVSSFGCMCWCGIQ